MSPFAPNAVWHTPDVSRLEMEQALKDILKRSKAKKGEELAGLVVLSIWSDGEGNITTPEIEYHPGDFVQEAILWRFIHMVDTATQVQRFSEELEEEEEG